MNCSYIFLICCLLSACSTSESLRPRASQEQRDRHSLKTTQLLRQNYGVIQCPRTDRYLKQILQPLIQEAGLSNHQRIEILDTTAVFSVTSELGEIFISKGLVQSLPSPGALSFIIAHELAHRALRHDYALSSMENELAADAWAQKLIYRVGFGVQDAEIAILIAHSSMHYFEQDEPNMQNYPAPADRIATVRAAVPTTSVRQSSAELGTREFKKFSMLLCK